MNCWEHDRLSRIMCILAVALSLMTISHASVSAQDASTDSSSALASLGLPELTVTITDAGVQLPPEAAAGLTYVTLDNQTENFTDATFVVQPEGLTLEQITADLAQTDTIPDWAHTTTFAGGPSAPAGGTGSAVVELSAGDWIIAQTATEKPAEPAVLRVTGEAVAAETGAVPSDLKVTMKGYKFDFPEEVAAGSQVWEVTNDDPVGHFAVLMYYPGPVTASDVEALLMSDPSTPQPNTAIDPSKLEEDGGFLPLHTQGKSSWVEVNLKPGSYIVLCFMSDQGSEVPHVFMGMYDVFTVPGEVASPPASPAAGIVESTIDVGGRSLHLACAGTGSPTVLFEPGGPFLDGGTAIIAAMGPDLSAALGTRFCAYDRAGTGGSDPYPAEVRTFREAAADLQAVLASPELECPCVVVGESLGGSIALVALAEDAAGIAGLVLLDPPYPGYYDRYLELAPPDSPELGPETERYNGGENEEQLDVITGFGQVAAPAEPPGIPVVVVTHGAGDPPGCWPCSESYPVADLEAAWQVGQAELAQALGGRLVVAENTGHSIAEENPELVISLVSEVIVAVRDPSTWTPPAATPSP